MLLLLSTFFGQNTVLFVPCPGQINALTVILNVIEQTDIYQHFKWYNLSPRGLNLKKQQQANVEMLTAKVHNL